MKSTIKLFKALPIEKKSKKITNSVMEELMTKTIKRGFVFSSEVIAGYSDYDELIKMVGEVYGITAEQLNNSFHKSWQKIKNADIKQLVLEQIIHYFTTYGFEALGVYNEDCVYIPKETLEIPDLEDDIKLVIIKGYTKNELKSKLLKLLNSGIALEQETINNVVDLSLYCDLKEDEIVEIKNKEAKIALYDYLNLIPSNPVEFLRYAVYKSTEETLLIKSSELIEKIKEQQNLGIIKLFNDYTSNYAPPKTIWQIIGDLLTTKKPIKNPIKTSHGIIILLWHLFCLILFSFLISLFWHRL